MNLSDTLEAILHEWTVNAKIGEKLWQIAAYRSRLTSDFRAMD